MRFLLVALVSTLLASFAHAQSTYQLTGTNDTAGADQATVDTNRGDMTVKDVLVNGVLLPEHLYTASKNGSKYTVSLIDATVPGLGVGGTVTIIFTSTGSSPSSQGWTFTNN